jgi:SAM-dependent methyltransferase
MEGVVRPGTGRNLTEGRWHAMRVGLFLGFLGVLAAHPVSAQEHRFSDEFRFKYEVPYVPTPQVTVDEMLRVAGVGPRDFVIDLGSGDGRIVITAAAKFGARGFGVDLDEELVAHSEENARRAGVEDRVKFMRQDLFKTDLSQATVIAMYLLPGVVRRLRPQLLALKPGTRIVSHDFDMDDWKPDRKTAVRKNVMLWIVPAPVDGRWQARLPLQPIERQLELILSQRYQEVSAHARLNGVPVQVWEMKLEGDRISFAVVDSTDRENEATLYFDGRVSGDLIEGDLVSGVGASRRTVPWRAARTGR